MQLGVRTEEIINIKRKKISKSEENHNIEEAYSVPRETKDSLTHRHNLISE